MSSIWDTAAATIRVPMQLPAYKDPKTGAFTSDTKGYYDPSTKSVYTSGGDKIGSIETTPTNYYNGVQKPNLAIKLDNAANPAAQYVSKTPTMAYVAIPGLEQGADPVSLADGTFAQKLAAPLQRIEGIEKVRQYISATDPGLSGDMQKLRQDGSSNDWAGQIYDTMQRTGNTDVAAAVSGLRNQQTTMEATRQQAASSGNGGFLQDMFDTAKDIAPVDPTFGTINTPGQLNTAVADIFSATAGAAAAAPIILTAGGLAVPLSLIESMGAGALAGMAGATASSVVGSTVRGEPITLKDVAEAAGKGVITGAVTAGAANVINNAVNGVPVTGAETATTGAEIGTPVTSVDSNVASNVAGDSAYATDYGLSGMNNADFGAVSPMPGGINDLSGIPQEQAMAPTSAGGQGVNGNTPTSLASLNGPTTTAAGLTSGQLALGALGIATPVVGGLIAADAQKDATNAAADASNTAATTAANATLTGTRESIAAQQKMYDTNRADFKPFLDMAPRSLATLQSSIYGTPESYTDPSGVKQTANGQQFDLAGLSKQQTDALTNFNPTDTAAYKWQKQQGDEALAHSLAAQGRGSGSTATNAAMRFAGNLGAQEYDKGYSRLSSLNDLNYNRMSGQKTDYQNGLLNLIKTAQGAAGSTSAAGTNFANQSSNAAISQGNNLANIATNNGTNQANAALANGQSQANLWNGLATLPFQGASLAIHGGWKPFA